MIKPEHVKEYLEAMARQHSSVVITKLQNGSSVLNTLSSRYLIDDIDIDRRLWKFPEFKNLLH